MTVFPARPAVPVSLFLVVVDLPGDLAERDVRVLVVSEVCEVALHLHMRCDHLHQHFGHTTEVVFLMLIEGLADPLEETAHNRFHELVLSAVLMVDEDDPPNPVELAEEEFDVLFQELELLRQLHGFGQGRNPARHNDWHVLALLEPELFGNELLRGPKKSGAGAVHHDRFRTL